jgi:cobalt/nickel transport protein
MKNKKLIIGLFVLIIITPIGIFLPEWFNAGDAWGEWSVEKVKEKIGFAPKGMEKDAEIYRAPLPDYSLADEDSSLTKQSGYYILSGIIGVAIISLISFGVIKVVKKE